MQSDRIFRQAFQTVKASDLTAEDGTDDTVGIFDRQRDIDLFFAGDSGFAIASSSRQSSDFSSWWFCSVVQTWLVPGSTSGL